MDQTDERYTRIPTDVLELSSSTLTTGEVRSLQLIDVARAINALHKSALMNIIITFKNYFVRNKPTAALTPRI